jgi:hypothetical protein
MKFPTLTRTRVEWEGVGVFAMANARFRSEAGDDQEALLYLGAVIVGGAAWLIVVSILGRQALGELVGFLAMCAAQFPFARTTWAVDVPVRRYWEGAFLGASLAAGLRLVLQ